MSDLNIGDVIGIRCDVRPGPFSDERLVSFDTSTGPVSGFVRESELKETDQGWLVRAVVKQISDDELEVMVSGSFFTTNGLAHLPRDAAVAA